MRISVLRHTLRLFGLGLLAAATLNASAQGLGDGRDLLTNRIIVKYRDGKGLASMSEALRLAGIALKERGFNRAGAELWRMERLMTLTEAKRVAADVASKDSNVLYAEPDLVMAPTMVLNDTRASEQWDLYDNTVGLRTPAAWDKTNGSGVKVAVLDTGYRPHADLNANIVGGYDFVSDPTMANDGGGRDANAQDAGDGVAAGGCGGGYPAQTQNSSWHGTHVSGTIAAVGNNAAGVAGVAWGAKVVPVRVLGKCGGYTSDIADAIVWAAGGTVSGVPANPNPAKVINLSLGGSGACGRTFQDAINTARGLGAVVVVAAGNSNTDVSTSSPANCSGVIAVAATGRTGGRAYYSNYGSLVTVAAPGGDMSTGTNNGILSTLNAGTSAPGADTFSYYQGTSMATPHVSGVAALMFAKNPALTPDALTAALKSSARAFPATCSQCGAGLVDANAAVLAVSGTTTTPTPSPTPAPTPTPTPTPTPAPVTGALTREAEPNNSIAQANVVSAATTVGGAISAASDSDFFSITIPVGKKLSTTLTGNAATANYDLQIMLPTGQMLVASQNSAGLADRIDVVNMGNVGVAIVARVVYASGPTGDTNGAYSLKVEFNAR